MRRTRTWTISLPPALSDLAEQVARREQRTKSELVREALRHYIVQSGQPLALGAGIRLSRVGELAELYRQRVATRAPSESALRESARGIRQLHDRLKHLAA